MSAISASMITARLDRLPSSRHVWKIIGLLSLGGCFEFYDLFFTAYVAPGLTAGGMFSATTVNLFGFTGFASFVAALFAGLFVGTIAFGFVADRFGRRAIFTGSLLWYTVANLAMAFQDTAFGLNVWRFLAGVGIGVELITIGTYLSEVVPKAIRGRAFAVCQAVGFTAVPVAAFLAYLLVPTSPFGIDGWRWVVMIGAMAAVFVWWIRRALPESPRWLAQQGRYDEADRILSRLESDVRRESGEPLPPPSTPPSTNPALTASPGGRFIDLWRPPYRERTLMLVIFHVFQTVGYYGWANWVPTLLIRQGITITTSLLYTAVIAIAAPLGPLLGYLFADRFERKTVIIVMAAVDVACGLAFSQTAGAVALIFLGVCLTLANNILSFTFHAYQAELFPTAIRARAVGFVYSWSRFSAIFTAFIIAFVLKTFGVTGVFVFIGAAMGIVMVTVGLMGPKTRDRALETISR